MNEPPLVVRDTNRTEYTLGRILGEGGQGRVHAVAGRPLAVKLLRASTGAERERINNDVARVRRLPLQELPLARPLALLTAPHAGYVMELLSGMIPLAALIHPPRGTQNILPWYLETGGLGRRLRLLARLADVVGALHGRGLSYGDMSPENAFISEQVHANEVWLIDCDNLHAGVAARAVYTPGYAAPELFMGHLGADSLSDAWSFATLAFETLTLLHPFDGDQVHDGDPSLEDAAFRGELPWVDDAADISNAASGRGLPREAVLSRRLSALSAECFGLSRLDRMKRPGIAAWAERLQEAADQLLVCPGCRGDYLLNRSTCPWCDTARPDFLLVDVRLVDQGTSSSESASPPGLVGKRGTASDVIVARTVVQAGRTTALQGRHIDSRSPSSHAAFVELRLDQGRLVLTGRPETDAVLASSDRRHPLAGITRELRLNQELPRWWLELPASSGLRRVAQFQWQPAARGP